MNLNPKNKDLIRIAHEIGIEHGIAAVADEHNVVTIGDVRFPMEQFIAAFVKKPDRDIQDEVRRRVR